VDVHADHRGESYVGGVGQVNETGGIDDPETDVDEASSLHSFSYDSYKEDT